MKQMLCIVLSAAMLLLCGCQSAGLTPGETEGMTEGHVDVTELQEPDATFPKGEQETGGGNAVELGETGCVRVSYNSNVRSVRYITSVEELPDNEALTAYDEAYFADKALLVVMETVGSGSVKVGIESVEDGVVTLSYEMPGDVGTADMATWLLWAEVEAGLDYDWSVANPAVEPNTSTH